MSIIVETGIDKYEETPDEETSRGIAELLDDYYHKEDYLAELTGVSEAY